MRACVHGMCVYDIGKKERSFSIELSYLLLCITHYIFTYKLGLRCHCCCHCHCRIPLLTYRYTMDGLIFLFPPRTIPPWPYLKGVPSVPCHACHVQGEGRCISTVLCCTGTCLHTNAFFSTTRSSQSPTAIAALSLCL